MPVRVKPPPAENGEMISPDLRGFGDHDAGERRAHRAVIELHLRGAQVGRGQIDLPALPEHLRRLGVDLRARLLDRLLGNEIAFDEVFVALHVAHALRELRLVLRRAAPARNAMRLRPARALRAAPYRPAARSPGPPCT